MKSGMTVSDGGTIGSQTLGPRPEEAALLARVQKQVNHLGVMPRESGASSNSETRILTSCLWGYWIARFRGR